MLQVATKSRMSSIHPYDFQTAVLMDGWRETLSWPIGLETTFPIGDRKLTGLAEIIRDTTDLDLRDVLVLAGTRVFVYGLPLIDMALTLQAAEAVGQKFASSFPELDFLRGDITLDELPARDHVAPLEDVRLVFLRRAKRMKLWTSWQQMPMTLVKPHATALSVNSLLQETAKSGPERIGFFHDEALLGAAMGHGKPQGNVALAEHATKIMCEHMIGDIDLPKDRHQRLRSLVAIKASGLFEHAVHALAAVKNFRGIPDRIWAASGGRWPGRVLSIEAMRRGSEVIRFDHAGGRGVHRFPAWPATLDMYCSTTFNLATQPLAERLKAQGVNDLLPPDRQCQLQGQNGDPTFKHLNLSRSSRHTDRRRVIYASGLLRGLLQTVPAQIPDLVYLDWQIRLAETLNQLPIDLVCKPHPEGIFAHQTHPLTSIAKVHSGPFEELIPSADVFVLDIPHSTTFYEALCTDRPIVFVDFGAPFFDTAIRAAIESRCRVIRTKFDDRNRPIIDQEALEDAVISGADVVDPTEFQALLMGAPR